MSQLKIKGLFTWLFGKKVADSVTAPTLQRQGAYRDLSRLVFDALYNEESDDEDPTPTPPTPPTDYVLPAPRV